MLEGLIPPSQCPGNSHEHSSQKQFPFLNLEKQMGVKSICLF